MRRHSLNWRAPATALQEICAQYFDLRQATWHPWTVRGRRYTVLSFIELIEHRYPKVTRLAQLRRHPHMEAWLQHIRPLRPITRRGYIGTLHQFFEDLIEWQWPDPPPSGLLQETDLPPCPPYTPQPFSPQDDDRLEQVLRRDPSVMSLGARILRQTGLRIGELLGLPLEAFSRNREGQYELRVPPGKTYTERVFPLSTPTVRLLQTLIRRRGMDAPGQPLPPRLMIDEQGLPVRYWTYRRFIKHAAALAGLAHGERAHLHQFRHTFATELARTNIPLPSLMRLLGHKRPEMTLRYVQWTSQDIRRTYEAALAQLQGTRLPSRVLRLKAVPLDTTVHDDFLALIDRIEQQRRDAQANPVRAASLSRLVPRLRAALRTLKNTP